MSNFVARLWRNELLRGTGLFFVGNMAVNFGGFMYHVIMARALGPAEYGILGSLVGLTYLVSVPVGAVDILVTKALSSLPSDRFASRCHGFLVYLGRKLKWWGVASAIGLLVATFPTARFLRLDSVAGVVLVWLIIYATIYSTIGLAVLRAMLMFDQVVVNQVVTMALRVSLAVLLAWVGGAVHLTAQIAIIISMLGGIGLLVYQTRFIFASAVLLPAPGQLNLRNLGLTSLVFSGAFTLMYSLDIVLVKHFLPQYWAGIYASVATGGKVVFFALVPIAVALLPVVARKVARGAPIRRDLLLVAGVSLLAGAGIVVIYFLTPALVVDILFSHRYIEAAGFLPWFGLAILGYSLANIFGSFLLALSRNHVVITVSLGMMAELISIVLFHGSLWQVIWSLTTVFWLLAAILFIQSWRATHAYLPVEREPLRT